MDVLAPARVLALAGDDIFDEVHGCAPRLGWSALIGRSLSSQG